MSFKPRNIFFMIPATTMLRWSRQYLHDRRGWGSSWGCALPTDIYSSQLIFDSNVWVLVLQVKLKQTVKLLNYAKIGTVTCISAQIFEPRRQKTCLRHAHSEALDQCVQSRSLIRFFTEHILDRQECTISSCGNKKGSDQTARMRMLISIFVWRTCQKVRFIPFFCVLCFQWQCFRSIFNWH